MSFTSNRPRSNVGSGGNNDGSDVSIDDNTKTKESTWSSSKISAELDNKSEKIDLDNHIKDTGTHITSDEKEKLGNIEDGAEKNRVTSVNGKIGNVTIDTPKNISELNDDVNVVTASDKGVNNGVASLDGNGIIPISQLPAEIKQVKVVNNIEERNVIEELFEGLFVYVLDASDDEVTGGASYIYDGAIWHKVAESSELDAVLDWLNIENKPTEFKPTDHTHKADEVIEDSEHRFVTDTEKSTWNAKSDFSGNYADLTSKPNIPSKVSDLEDDIGIITDVSDKSDIGHEHDERYYTREEIDGMDFGSGGGGEFDGTVEWNNVLNKPQNYPPSEHNHDNRYNTKEEVQGHIDYVTNLMGQERGKVAVTSGDTPDFLENKVDNVTLAVQGTELKVKTLDGLIIGTTDINDALEGVEGNIQAQLNDLLSLLGSLSGGMKFKDIAETRVEINNWGNKENGDVAVVLADETRSNGRSMYVYSDELGMWRYLGTFTFTTKFTALKDTPSNYENGKYLKSTNDNIVYSDISYNDLVNKPSSTITQIDGAVAKSHEHTNKSEIDRIGINASGQITVDGVPYVPEPKDYLYARVSSGSIAANGTWRWIKSSSKGITLMDNGIFILEKGKTYHITANLSMTALSGWKVVTLIDTETRSAPPEASNQSLVMAVNSDRNEAHSGVLSLIITPTSTRNFGITITSGYNATTATLNGRTSLTIVEI